MLTSLVATLTHWFAGWNTAYADSKVLETSVTAVHVVALLVGGGIAIAADRDTLRARHRGPGMERQALHELHATHRPVVISLLVLWLSGLALAAADVPTFAHSPVFLIKILLVTLLCFNGVFLARTEHVLRHRMFAEIDRPQSSESIAALWRRLRVASWVSITLWICTTIAGTALVNAG